MKKILPFVSLFLFAIVDAYGQAPTFGLHLVYVETYEGFDESIGAPVYGETSIEWRKNGVVIPGGTSEFYQIDDTELTEAGTYTLTASNADGSSSTQIVVEVDKNTAPTAELLEPVPGKTFTPGNDLSISLLKASVISNTQCI
jgi:hypothetical protein